MLPAPSERQFPARYAALPDLLGMARAAAHAAGLDNTACARIELVLEEAFSNTVRHGYGGESDRPVWLACRILPDGIEIVYRDAAPHFDPLVGVAPPTGDQPGGVGRLLIKHLPASARYLSGSEGNQLVAVFKRAG